MSDALTATQMALAREQKLTDLGGVIAAAAHELGTPLATIALVAGEMLDELDPDSDLHSDAQLLRDQAERCRVILRSMGRAGKRDNVMTRAPIGSVVEEAAEPHQNRGVAILFDISPETGRDDPQPVILRRPEIIHGLRNLIQNAVDFAESTVWIDIRWSTTEITLRIADDGPGYPNEMLPFLGDPFLRNRREAAASSPQRTEYQGMGLGLFIAKTLLERSGAELTFANGHPLLVVGSSSGARLGALVTVIWPRDGESVIGEDRSALGDNILIVD